MKRAIYIGKKPHLHLSYGLTGWFNTRTYVFTPDDTNLPAYPVSKRNVYLTDY